MCPGGEASCSSCWWPLGHGKGHLNTTQTVTMTKQDLSLALHGNTDSERGYPVASEFSYPSSFIFFRIIPSLSWISGTENFSHYRWSYIHFTLLMYYFSLFNQMAFILCSGGCWLCTWVGQQALRASFYTLLRFDVKYGIESETQTRSYSSGLLVDSFTQLTFADDADSFLRLWDSSSHSQVTPNLYK